MEWMNWENFAYLMVIILGAVGTMVATKYRMVVKELKEVVNIINNVQFNIGKLESQKHNLLHELVVSQNKIIEMQDTFSKEYGTHDINVMDGTINWPKEENKDEK